MSNLNAKLQINFLAVQRTKTNVQFHNVDHNNVPNGSERKLEKKEYSQSCKSKNATILGFVWTRYGLRLKT